MHEHLCHFSVSVVAVVRCIFCGFVCFFSSQLCCPLRFQNSPHTCLWEGFLLCGNFSFMPPSPGWVSIPKSFVSVVVFYILSYLLWKRLGCLFGCLLSSASIQKLFCGSCSTFKWSFDEFVGEKVVSLSYSCAILGPPHFILKFPQENILNQEFIVRWSKHRLGFPGGASDKECRRPKRLQVRSLCQEDPLKEEMATHSSVLTWRIPWTEEPGGLQSIGSQRVGHDWRDLEFLQTQF